jgi:hypothetical protein
VLSINTSIFSLRRTMARKRGVTMLFIVDKKNKSLREVRSETFQDLNVWERKDLEKWIEDYPSILGEELFVISTEYDKFDKTNDRLDVLAIDRNGKLVIVELKRDIAPATTELQAIKYAAFCSTLTFEDVVEIHAEWSKLKGREKTENKAEEEIRGFIQQDDFENFDNKPRIILAAKEFRTETMASILWLRSYEVDISCVKLELYSLKDETGKDTVAICPTVIIPLPDAKNYIISRERKEAESAELSRSQQFNRTLFDRLIERFKNECPNITERNGTKDSWMALPIGYAYMHFEWTFRRRPKNHFIVSLDFEKPTREENEVILAELEKSKEYLESKMGEKINYEHQWGERWSRLYVVNESVDDVQKLDDWVINTTKKFYKYIKPKLDEAMKNK